MNPENIEEHKFQPGQSGNPNGRPKGSKNSKTLLAKYLGAPVKVKNPLTNEDDVVTAAEAMFIALIGKALKGDVGAIKEVYDRFEGRANQRVELSNPEGDLQPMNVNNLSLDVSSLSTDVLEALSNAYQQQNGKTPVALPVAAVKAATPKASAKGGDATKGSGNSKGRGKK